MCEYQVCVSIYCQPRQVCTCENTVHLHSTVHELKLTLPLKREKGHHHKCGEIEIELNDLHVQLSSTNADGQDNRTANASSAQNGPTTSAASSGAAGTVAAVTEDFNLMQLDTPQSERRAGSNSPSMTTPTPTSTSTAGATTTASGAPSTSTANETDRQTGLAVPGVATVAAVGGVAAVGAATSGNTRVPTPTPPAAANQTQRIPAPQVWSMERISSSSQFLLNSPSVHPSPYHICMYMYMKIQ